MRDDSSDDDMESVLPAADDTGERALRAELSAAMRSKKIVMAAGGIAALIATLAIGALVLKAASSSALPVCGSRSVTVQSCVGKTWSSSGTSSAPYFNVPCYRAASPSLASGAGGVAGPITRIDSYDIPTVSPNVLWPWGSGQCGGLGGPPWKASDGADLARVVGEEVARLTRFGVKGGVSIDIGAHMGDTSISMALVSDRVIAFEPNPMVYPYTEALADINPSLNIDSWNFGVSDAKGELKFEYGGMCNGGVAGFGITRGGGGGGGQTTVTLHVVALAPFLAEHYPPSIIPQIGFIKMDTEGYDAVILKSLAPLIKQICTASKCPIIQVEWFDAFRDDPNDAGSKRLFESFKSLPGTWDVVCSAVCNSPKSVCDHAEKGAATKMTGPDDPNRGPCQDLVLTHVPLSY
jgi:FkbM family methyltransferase